MSSPFMAQRGSGNVTVILRKNDPAPPVPYELQNVYSSDIWASRVQAATSAAQKWSRQLTERIYFFSVFIIQFIVPSLISNLVLADIYGEGEDRQIPPERFFQYRAVGMGIFLGIFILFWTPLVVWKIIGNRKLRALEKEWLALDRATSGGGFIPKWSVGKPGIFKSAMTIRITVPSVAVMTNFHPSAPLPPYINPASTQAPPYDYGYAKSNCESGSKQVANLTSPTLPSIGADTSGDTDVKDPPLEQAVKLRPLTTLKWPNVEPLPAIVDPLTSSDPKPLQLSHYEVIATSPKIRALLEENPHLSKILKAIDKLGGTERERAFEAILGVSTDLARTPGSHRGNAFYWLPEGTNEEDMEILGQFVQALSSVMLRAERIGGDRQAGPVALETAE